MAAHKASSVSAPEANSLLDAWSDSLYTKAAAEGLDIVFTQEKLMKYDVVPDAKHLVGVLNKLIADCLAHMVTVDDRPGIKLRPKADAARIRELPNDNFRKIYYVVEEAGRDGTWAAMIKKKSSVVDTAVTNGLKYLENFGYITSFRSAQHPGRKSYIISRLRPSDQATGGTWTTDGELDEGLLNALQKVIFRYIKDKSTCKPPVLTFRPPTARQPVKGRVKVTGFHSSQSKPVPPHTRLLPMPAGYQGYPTTSEITDFISSSGVTSEPLKKAEIEQILNILRREQRIETVRLRRKETGWRVSRPASIPVDDGTMPDNNAKLGIAQVPETNALSTIPCIGCPVQDECGPGNNVSPATCGYWKRWMDEY